jgi:DNA polymerase III subunit delta'
MVAREAGGGGEGQQILPGEADLGRRLAAGTRLDRWVEVWENLRGLFGRADSVNLDRKQVVLEAFLTLEAASR